MSIVINVVIVEAVAAHLVVMTIVTTALTTLARRPSFAQAPASHYMYADPVLC